LHSGGLRCYCVPVNALSYSPRGLALTKSHEGCKLTAYHDAVGRLTIGWGHTGPEVIPGLVWTQQQADEALASDASKAASSVNGLVTVPLNQNQFDALVDFVFNLGAGRLQNSTLLRLLNAGDYSGAALQFKRWIYGGSVVLDGLVARRADEMALFNSPE
jgi:lysozyme